jgi:hypothetical protein
VTRACFSLSATSYLDQNGLVTLKVTTKGRTGHDSAESKKGAPHTEYTLTKKGLGLNDITIAMRAYGKKYL